MATIILYASSHGTTGKAANLLSEYLDDKVDVVNLKKQANPDIEQYEAIIIGGSIHAGQMQSKVKKFIEKNNSVLLAKQVGLFICCMEEKEAQKQFENSFPQELRAHSSANGLFGGEFVFAKMNFLEKQIVKKVSGITSDISKIDEDAIQAFAQQITGTK